MKFKCNWDGCAGTSAYYSIMKEHEKKCSCNPKFKNCLSCVYHRDNFCFYFEMTSENSDLVGSGFIGGVFIDEKIKNGDCRLYKNKYSIKKVKSSPTISDYEQLLYNTQPFKIVEKEIDGLIVEVTEKIELKKNELSVFTRIKYMFFNITDHILMFVLGIKK